MKIPLSVAYCSKILIGSDEMSDRERERGREPPIKQFMQGFEIIL